MTVRDERAAAIRRRHRDLDANFTDVLPLLLDDLERIDEAHAAGAGNGTAIGRYPAAEPEPAAPARTAARRRRAT